MACEPLRIKCLDAHDRPPQIHVMFELKPLDNSNGSLKLNPAPGLGVEMNRAYLEANEVA